MKMLVIDSRDIDRLTKGVKQALEGGPVQVEIKASRKRSLSQNTLAHVWFEHLSRWLVSKGKDFATPAWVKDAMKHTYLGYQDVMHTDVTTGLSVRKEVLRHTSDLDVGEMKLFMDMVYGWALNYGVLLPIPEDSQYAELKKVENGLD